MLASILTRGARFFLVAALLRRYGEPVREFIEKRLTLVTTAATSSGVVEMEGRSAPSTNAISASALGCNAADGSSVPPSATRISSNSTPKSG